MELKIVRTVFRGNLNDVGVYADTKGGEDQYYTVVSVFSTSVAKELASRLTIGGLFSGNRDYIGSFTHNGALNLVFVYHPESRLMNKSALYAPTFAKQKEVALSFLAALAETGAEEDVGKLLIMDENVNIAPGGKVYLNYFLDFKRFTPNQARDRYYYIAANYAAEILAREYAAQYGGQTDMYPHELCLMYKKIKNRTFRSLSQIMAFVRSLPDKPARRKFGAMRILGAFEGAKNFVAKKPANLFLAAVVLVTVIYLGYQVALRSTTSRSVRENTVFEGMRQIGEIYLGEEDF
jgi:hypothetical protein